MKVIYARLPALFRHAYQQIQIVESKITLDPVISILVRTWPAMINECTFCVDIAKAAALYKHLTLDKLEALPSYRTSPLFDARERAALAYVEEATRRKHVERRDLRRAPDALQRARDRRDHLAERARELLQPLEPAARHRGRRALRHRSGGSGAAARRA